MGDKLELPRQPEREATDAIRGFEYQRWASLELWLNLKDGEAIHVEWTEDVAVASRESGLAIQVKGTAAPVSLRQQKVRDLLEAAWARDRRIQTGLLTTSSIGNERHRGLLKGQAGIAYWQAVQAGTAPIEALKDFLLADEKLSVRTREAIRKSDAAAFEAFVRSVVWITDAPQLAGLQRRVLARLVEILADHPVPANAAKHVLPALLERITRASIDKDPQLRVLDRTERQSKRTKFTTKSPCGHHDGCAPQDDRRCG